MIKLINNFDFYNKRDDWTVNASLCIIICFFILPFNQLITKIIINFYPNFSELPPASINLLLSLFEFLIILIFVLFSNRSFSFSQKLFSSNFKSSYWLIIFKWLIVMVIIAAITIKISKYIIDFFHIDINQTTVMDQNVYLRDSKNNVIGINFRNLIYLCVYGIIVAPLLEELIYRKIFFIFLIRFFKELNFNKVYSVIIVTIILSLAWMLNHVDRLQFLDVFISGILLQWLYIKYDTIFITLFVHILFNFAVFFNYILKIF